MTIKELLNQAVIMLKNENIDAPKNKARMLLQATMKKTREYLMIYDTKEVTPEERDKYIKNVKAKVRIQGNFCANICANDYTGIHVKRFACKEVSTSRQVTEMSQ